MLGCDGPLRRHPVRRNDYVRLKVELLPQGSPVNRDEDTLGRAEVTSSAALAISAMGAGSSGYTRDSNSNVSISKTEGFQYSMTAVCSWPPELHYTVTWTEESWLLNEQTMMYEVLAYPRNSDEDPCGMPIMTAGASASAEASASATEWAWGAGIWARANVEDFSFEVLE